MKPRSLRFTWSMKTTSTRDPNEIMAEIREVSVKKGKTIVKKKKLSTKSYRHFKNIFPFILII